MKIKGRCQLRRHRPAVLRSTRLHARVSDYVEANRWPSTCVEVPIESELQLRICLEFRRLKSNVACTDVQRSDSDSSVLHAYQRAQTAVLDKLGVDVGK